MIRWVVYLLIALAFDLVSFMVAPILPALARNGWLPPWLWWFQTPDNSLFGDAGWRCQRDDPWSYWSQVCWLWRNHGYGLRWGPLAAPMMLEDLSYTGDLRVNRNNGRFGTLKVSMGKFWQWKMVKPIGATGYCVMFNFGWLLNDFSQPKALFMCSPRVAKITLVDDL